MAMRGYRPERVGSLLREVLSAEICFRLQDPRVEPLTTITRVEVTGDLSIARVFLSVPGGEAAERRTLAALVHAGGFLRRVAAREVPLRQTPELRFEIDESTKTARETWELLRQNRIARGEPPEGDAAQVSRAADEDTPTAGDDVACDRPESG